MVRLASTYVVFFALSVLPVFSIAQEAKPTTRAHDAAIDQSVITAQPAAIAAERMIGGLNQPWSLAFLPDGDMLVTEKLTGVRRISSDFTLGTVLEGRPPEVYAHTESGYLDVVLDPDFDQNQRLFIAYVTGTEQENRVAIWRARLDGNRLVDGSTIFRSHDAKAGAAHSGGRMVFLPDNTLLLTIGDGYDYKVRAQDMSSHLGKIVRLNRDGTVPSDNPFVDEEGTLPEIYTSGHRNVQGLIIDPDTGVVWAHEHGPRGGDEINLIEEGGNYGWPIATHGIDYDGTIISALSHVSGVTRSSFFWAPSIAPSGLAVYRGQAHPDWSGKFFVGGLASRSLSMLRRGEKTGLFVEESRPLVDLHTRLRDVRVGPDEEIYVLTDGENGELWRLTEQR